MIDYTDDPNDAEVLEPSGTEKETRSGGKGSEK